MYNTLVCAIYYMMVFLLIVFLLAITASCEPVRYYVKILTIVLASIIPASIHCPFMLLRIGDWRNALLTAGIVQKVVKLVGLTFEIRGKENIVHDSGSIIVTNHQSLLDMAGKYIHYFVTFSHCPL